ncbi:MAG: crossover junction endodeoxyribonuclease RuvC [Clostridiaceae bacterium]|jgi:crossover junction endodeoxyribonuclease RuvC|nr:crossover junction endodeoxyribonuclease RuvC [Oscillospiraceae bacterium]NLO62122.1 crossover junction endodeoxyribonuclease RuvC [Clostridiaceae bacterium]
MIIIGIDPGYAITGYGIIEHESNRSRMLDFGVVSTQPRVPFELRLLTIYQELEALIRRYSPDVMAVEELFFSRNTTTAIGSAQARGVAILAGAKAGIPVYEYTPMQVKLAVTGYGRADKNQVSQMVKTILCLDKIPAKDDASDALAIAICQAHTGMLRSNKAVGGYQIGPTASGNIGKHK